MKPIYSRNAYSAAPHTQHGCINIAMLAVKLCCKTIYNNSKCTRHGRARALLPWHHDVLGRRTEKNGAKHRRHSAHGHTVSVHMKNVCHRRRNAAIHTHTHSTEAPALVLALTHGQPKSKRASDHVRHTRTLRIRSFARQSISGISITTHNTQQSAQQLIMPKQCVRLKNIADDNDRKRQAIVEGGAAAIRTAAIGNTIEWHIFCRRMSGTVPENNVMK